YPRSHASLSNGISAKGGSGLSVAGSVTRSTTTDAFQSAAYGSTGTVTNAFILRVTRANECRHRRHVASAQKRPCHTLGTNVCVGVVRAVCSEIIRGTSRCEFWPPVAWRQWIACAREPGTGCSGRACGGIL